MLFSELFKIMVNKVTFVGLRRAIAPNRPLGSALALPSLGFIKIEGVTQKRVTYN